MHVLWAMAASGVNGLALLAGWGSLTTYWNDGPRTLVAIGLMAAPPLIALLAPNAGAGRLQDLPGQRFRVLGAVFVQLPLCYAAVAYLDAHGWLLRPDWPWLRWAGVALFAAGGVLMFWAVIVLGRRYSIFVTRQEDHQLVMAGPYAVIRHPVYLGFVIWVLGLVLVFRSWGGLLVLAAIVAGAVSKLRREERFLGEQFTDAYPDYQRRTWRLLPYVY